MQQRADSVEKYGTTVVQLHVNIPSNKDGGSHVLGGRDRKITVATSRGDTVEEARAFYHNLKDINPHILGKGAMYATWTVVVEL